ncbi:HAT, C-terminal dimerisation domain [Cinara cedri]|uniref:HAT, C-terminal dimerisation domain n=1 Tax=Cinara cedri TaxID=506608 RepID=A0A5E4M1B6_9HEMI|nr:HAT, C-terminal dimerisation domain [Cinara cedri]
MAVPNPQQNIKLFQTENTGDNLGTYTQREQLAKVLSNLKLCASDSIKATNILKKTLLSFRTNDNFEKILNTMNLHAEIYVLEPQNTRHIQKTPKRLQYTNKPSTKLSPISSTVTAERFFSALRRLKIYLRSTMTQKRLTHMMILHVYKSMTAYIDLKVTAKEFVSRTSQRKSTFGNLY